jgi:acetyl esterase/lipase
MRSWREVNRVMAALDREQQSINLIGGTPDQAPEACALASPIAHVRPGCPPTLLFHGEHDGLVPVASTRELAGVLADAGVPVVSVEVPQTDHAFDLILPRIAPAAQAALYDLDRFLALMALSAPRPGS